MLLLISLVLIFVAFLVLSKINGSDSVYGLCSIICGILLFLLLIAWPCVYYSYKASISEFKIAENTVEVARQNKNISEYELAALQTKIIQCNGWLASAKYSNGLLILDMFVPDEVDSLRYME